MHPSTHLVASLALALTLGCGSERPVPTVAGGMANSPALGGGSNQAGSGDVAPPAGGSPNAGSSAALGGQGGGAGTESGASGSAASGGVPELGEGGNVFGVEGDEVTLNGQPFKAIGLRLSNALISEADTQELIDNLSVYKSYGLNTVSVFVMGSRFGDVQGYLPDATLSNVHAARLGRIIEAADARDMVVLVGCLYWGDSAAKSELGAWGQAQANAAVANTVAWLDAHDYRNVFVDPDNEGMSEWDIASMIDAAHAVDPSIMVAANETNVAPDNADLLIHHSPRVEGKPWLETEGFPTNPDYWGSFSKETSETSAYYNYSRIGRYTEAMKAEVLQKSTSQIQTGSGYMLSSTWLQCGPGEGIGGPFMNPGGHSEIADVDADRDALHPDAGVLWWLEAMQESFVP